MPGKWIRRPNNGMCVVYVHGILSSGETCWRHDNGACWPELLAQEPTLGDAGIYVFSYQTGIFSGSYSLNDVVDELKEWLLVIDRVADCRTILFVCHSMGGLVVRKFLVERAADLIDRGIDVGLFLVASPSLGSFYANWLTPIARLMGHAQADALRFCQDNAWLNGLDKEFINLKESGRLPMRGKELVEDRFVVLRRFLRKQVVEPFSGARYFGEAYRVPGSDHFSIAKPDGREAVQHRLLVALVEAMEKEATAARPGSTTGAGSVEGRQRNGLGAEPSPERNGVSVSAGDRTEPARQSFDPASSDPAAPGALGPEVVTRVRDLLLTLPGWNDKRRRRTFVNAALWGHPVLKHVELDGAGAEVAADLVERCMEFDEPDRSGLSPLCALLVAIPKEFGAKPERDRDLFVLNAALNCMRRTR